MPALSHRQRETLTNLLLNDKYADHHKQVAEEKEEIFRAIWNLVFNEQIYKLAKESGRVNWYFQDSRYQSIRLPNGEYLHSLCNQDGRELPFPQAYTNEIVYSDAALCDRMNSLFYKETDATDERKRLRVEIMAKLGEFRTHKQLLDGWPEIESYAKQALGLNVAKVPSVNVHSLNEKLGLPK